MVTNKYNYFFLFSGILLTKISQRLRVNQIYTELFPHDIWYNSMPNFIIALILPVIWDIVGIDAVFLLEKFILNRKIRVCIQSFLILFLHEVIRFFFLKITIDFWDLVASILGLSIHYLIYTILKNEQKDT